MPERTMHEEELARIIAYNNPVKFFLWGVLSGALIGGTLALLYAPMKGSDTRKLIKTRAEDAVQLVQNRVENFRERAGEVAADVQAKAMETRKKGEEMLKAVKDSGS